MNNNVGILALHEISREIVVCSDTGKANYNEAGHAHAVVVLYVHMGRYGFL